MPPFFGETAWTDSAPACPDGLCANSFFHLIADRQAALAHMFRLLQPGGFFVTSTPCLGESWVPYRPLLSVAHWLGKAPEAWVFTKQTLAEEIQRAGFVDLSFPDVGAKAEIGFMIARRPG
jgi:arsenite methyltransferase